MSSSGIFKMVEVRGTLRRVEEFIIELTPPSSPELSDHDTDSELGSNEEIEELNLAGSEDPSDSNATVQSTSTTSRVVSSSSEIPNNAQSAEPQPEGQLEHVPEPINQSMPEVELEPQLEELSPLAQPLQEFREAIRTEPMSGAQVNGPERLRRVVLDYLHYNIATLADVQALVPEFNRDLGIMNKLVTNLGYNYTGFRISEAKMTLIREYLFISGSLDSNREPWKYWEVELYSNIPYRLLDAVYVKCEQFRRGMVGKNQSQRIIRREQQRVEAAEAPQHRLTRHQIEDQIKEFPLHMQIPPEIPDLLPIGANTAAEIYFKIYGFSWAESQALGDSTRPYRRLIPAGDPVKQESQGKYFACTKTIFFVQGRRAHKNRSGTIRPPRHVPPSLPPANAYRLRTVVDTSHIPQYNQRGNRFASTRQIFETIDLRHNGTAGRREVVVRLPPRETVTAAPPAQISSSRANAVAIPLNLPIRSARNRLKFTTQDMLHDRQEQQSNIDNE